MKTGNNLKKAAAAFGIGFAVLVLTAGSPAAQGAVRTTANENMMEPVTVRHSADGTGNVKKAAIKEAYVTESHELAAVSHLTDENAMINVEAFIASIHYEEAVDEPLNLEEWMTDKEVFTVKGVEKVPTAADGSLYLDYYLKKLEEKDKPLRLEKWMVNNRIWIR
jgi:hypothetical protein